MIENFNLNINLFRAINNFSGKNDFMDMFFIFCANNLIYLMLGFYLAYFLKQIYRDQKVELKEFFLYFSSAFLAWLFVILIKNFYWVQRPSEFLKNVNVLVDYGNSGFESFPSGHTAFSFALFASVFMYNKKLGFLFLIGAIFVSFSRIYTGVHYPLDIYVGSFLGFFVTVFFHKIFVNK